MSIEAPKSNKADVSVPTQNLADRPNLKAQEHRNAAKPATTLESVSIKAGQAVQAKVIAILNAANSTSAQNKFFITLEITEKTPAMAGKTLLVSTNIQLQPGQRVNLQADAQGDLLLARPETKGTSPLIKAISQVLPYQQPIGKTVATLLSNLPLMEKLNIDIKALTGQLIQLLPKTADFKPTQSPLPPSSTLATALKPQSLAQDNLQAIKQAINRSGILMENRLAEAGRSIAASGSPLLDSKQPAPRASSDIIKQIMPGHPRLSPQAVGNTSPPSPLDLKSVIIQLISALNSAYKATLPANSLTPKIIAESDPALLINPFNFPTQATATKLSDSYQEQKLSLGDLLKRLVGALNRIQFNQLNSLYQSQSSSSETATVQTWQMEIPFLNPQKSIDPIQVRIDQEKSKNGANSDDEKQSKWKLALAFDIDSLGPLFVHVNLTPPNISSTIWAERKETLKLINAESGSLRESLTNIGLTVNDISCRHGQPHSKKTRLEQQIVDVKA